jgi:hypothetical protein
MIELLKEYIRLKKIRKQKLIFYKSICNDLIKHGSPKFVQKQRYNEYRSICIESDRLHISFIRLNNQKHDLYYQLYKIFLRHGGLDNDSPSWLNN